MITVGDEVFHTKKALEDKTRAILWSYKPGQRLNEDHFKFILNLLRNHEHAVSKIGPGVVAFVVMNDDFGSQGFRAVWVDGKIVPFSYKSCVTKKSPDSDFKNALRREVVDQIFALRDAVFAKSTHVPCAVTGEIVTAKTCHVDHMPPNTFEAIVADFVSANNIDVSNVKVCNGGVGMKKLVDRKLAELWSTYHKSRAVLRVVSKKANLSDIRKMSRGG